MKFAVDQKHIAIGQTSDGMAKNPAIEPTVPQRVVPHEQRIKKRPGVRRLETGRKDMDFLQLDGSPEISVRPLNAFERLRRKQNRPDPTGAAYQIYGVVISNVLEYHALDIIGPDGLRALVAQRLD